MSFCCGIKVAYCMQIVILCWFSFEILFIQDMVLLQQDPLKIKKTLLEYKGTLISRDEGKKLHQKYAKEGLRCYIFDVEYDNKNLWYGYICFVMINLLIDMH